MKLLLRIFLLTLVSSTSFAAGNGDTVLFGLGAMKFDQQTEGADLGTSKVTNTYYDVKLGYTSSWLYLGGIYSAGNNESNGSQTKRTALGGTAGIHGDNFLLDLSYFFQAEREAGTTVLGEGSGYGIDFGYNTMVGNNFFLGLQLSYKSFNFKNKEVAAVTTAAENKIVSEMYPMINLGFMF